MGCMEILRAPGAAESLFPAVCGVPREKEGNMEVLYAKAQGRAMEKVVPKPPSKDGNLAGTGESAAAFGMLRRLMKLSGILAAWKKKRLRPLPKAQGGLSSVREPYPSAPRRCSAIVRPEALEYGSLFETLRQRRTGNDGAL
ncbi:hypothetical protein [Mailhella massiliensis]|uniref:hypothetical protein n=1 Tax=Mailhella massiliensis TaxID=1903261 RepID=UPI0023F30457|nr:hypothetical protein [Mailhella massiliensis]